MKDDCESRNLTLLDIIDQYPFLLGILDLSRQSLNNPRKNFFVVKSLFNGK